MKLKTVIIIFLFSIVGKQVFAQATQLTKEQKRLIIFFFIIL